MPNAPAPETAARLADEFAEIIKARETAAPGSWKAEEAWDRYAAFCRDNATAILAALRSSQDETWRKIGSAPRDGTEFLAWPCEFNDGMRVVKARWYHHPNVSGWLTDEINCNDYEFAPTHWRPLPSPPHADPKAEQEGGES